VDESKVLTVYEEESSYEFMSRLQFVLIELGIKVRVVEEHPDCAIYALSHAERIDGKEKEFN